MRYWMGFIGGVLLLLPVLCRGQHSNNQELANQYFSEGNAHMTREDFSSAAQAFKTAYEINPSWKFWYYIGQAQAGAGSYGLALDAYAFYLAEGRERVSEERSEAVVKEIERLRKSVGILLVDAPDGTVLLVDNSVRGEAPFAEGVNIAAGRHRVALQGDGGVLATQEVNIVAGHKYQIAGGVDAVNKNVDPVTMGSYASMTMAEGETGDVDDDIGFVSPSGQWCTIGDERAVNRKFLITGIGSSIGAVAALGVGVGMSAANAHSARSYSAPAAVSYGVAAGLGTLGVVMVLLHRRFKHEQSVRNWMPSSSGMILLF